VRSHDAALGARTRLAAVLHRLRHPGAKAMSMTFESILTFIVIVAIVSTVMYSAYTSAFGLP